MKTRIFLLFLLLLTAVTATAQSVAGKVVDATTGEALPFVNVVFGPGIGTQTDTEGQFKIAFRTGTLTFSTIGYRSEKVKISQPGTLTVKLEPNDQFLKEAVVKAKKKKYSRKNNPAVELMRKVIAAKKKHDLKLNDYYSVDQYNKLVFSLNEVTEKVFEEGKFKRMPFLKEHVETCNETGKLILPVSVTESVERNIYRKHPEADKTIILAQRSNGVNDLFNTGDIMTTMLQDFFTRVDIYDNEIVLLHKTFTSPISSHSAIGFYRYFIVDTLKMDTDSCIRLDFTPNNPQDFGFSGSLYIINDSTYRVKKADLGIPANSAVNFVDRMRIIQEFRQLPDGQQVLTRDNMLIQLKLVDFIQKFQVKRTTEYSNFRFDSIPDQDFRFSGQTRTEADAMIRDEAYWNQHRPEALSYGESHLDRFVDNLTHVKGFRPFMFVAKAFIENHVEATLNPEKPPKVDIGPINTIVSQNFVDGLRLRASARTTAHLNPHLFLRGYVAYGFKDERWKGLGEVTYSFNKKAYSSFEFPVNNLTFTYNRDVMSPSDKFLPTDKDNVFVSFKWTTVDHMQYYEYYRLLWEREWGNGLRFSAQFRSQKDEPTAALFYQPLDAAGAPVQDPARYRRTFRTNEVSLGLNYQPGTTWINSKQRRIPSNHYTPRYQLTHTTGLYPYQGKQFAYNVTEASFYQRFLLASWGKLDMQLKSGIQWNQVPFPLLIAPAANLSYVREENTFHLINNMEFLNDRYASAILSWDIGGKLLNRIPLIRKLKWREVIGCNVLWGNLTDKNNPFLPQNTGNSRLFYFPGHFNADGSFSYLSQVMDPKVPYVEVSAGLHNIFKVLRVEYVRRLTYLDRPGTDKWGVRVALDFSF